MTSEIGGAPPTDVLTGLTSGQLGRLFVRCQLGLLASVPFVMVGFYLPAAWSAWRVFWIGLAVVLGLAGLVLQWLGISRTRAEQAAGYTTNLSVAVQHPELSVVHPYTRQVLAAPHEPRPYRITRTGAEGA